MFFLNNNLLTSVWTLGLLTTGSFIKPALSEPSSIELNLSEQCLQAVSSVLEDIKRNGVENPTLYRYTENANQNHYGNPTDRKASLHLALADQDKDVKHVLASKKLMAFWANQIVSSCSNVAVVTFGEWQTDKSVEYAIQANQTVKRRKCLKSEMASSSDQIPWDKKSCDIGPY